MGHSEPKVADPERPVSAARREPEGPEGNLAGDWLFKSLGSRQEPGGYFGRPAGAPARVTRLEKSRVDPDMRRRLSKDNAVEESGQEAQADPGPQGFGWELRGWPGHRTPPQGEGQGSPGKPLEA